MHIILQYIHFLLAQTIVFACPGPDCGSRRDNDNFLIVPKMNRVTFGGIAFKRAAPDLWNSILSSLRKSKTVDIFKSGLKTLLFKRAFNLE